MRISPDFDNNTLDQSQPTAKNREGESDKFWFRSERFFAVGNQWFFTTREHIDVGPFADRATAEHALMLFLDCLKKEGTSVEYAVSVAKQGDWAIARFH